MNAIYLPPNPLASSPELLHRLALIMAGLAALIARRFVRMPHLVAFSVPLWRRLSHVVRRFAAAIARSDTPRRTRARHADARMRRASGLPSGRGWLVRELGWEAAGFGCQLEALLADPAMQALLIAVPGVGRVLRPLCRMLAVPVVAALVPKPLAVAAPAERSPQHQSCRPPDTQPSRSAGVASPIGYVADG